MMDTTSDGTNLTDGITVFDLVTGLAIRESGRDCLVIIERNDGRALTSYEPASTAAKLLARSKHAIQWQGLANKNVAHVVKMPRLTTTLYIITITD